MKITSDMIKIYKMDTTDWMGYTMTHDNPYTFHHIIKREHGGAKTIDNGAILTKISHKYLHLIEYKEPQIYHAITGILLIINKQGKKPTQEQLEVIDTLLNIFEEKHMLDKTSRGTNLIKKEYITKRLVKR